MCVAPLPESPLCLLAKIDRWIAETDRLASAARLDAGERDYVSAQLDYRRKAVERVQAMLGDV